MGRLSRLTSVCKLAILILAGVLCARGQYIGNVGQASTASNFTAPASASQTIVPTCDASHTTNCIAMIGQASHLVQVFYPGEAECTVWMDGSNDGVNWATLAAITFFHISLPRFGQQTMTANGWYQLIRLKVNPGSGDSCGAMTGTYSGWQYPLPLSPLGANFTSDAVGSAVNLSGLSVDAPYLVQGVSCYNPNSSVAWLELYDHGGTPTLGTDAFFFEQAIPATSSFTYSGPNLEGTLMFWIAAVTAHAGATPVSTALNCNVQINYNGPFLPLTPSSP